MVEARGLEPLTLCQGLCDLLEADLMGVNQVQCHWAVVQGIVYTSFKS